VASNSLVDEKVSLPPGLTIGHIKKAVDEIESIANKVLDAIGDQQLNLLSNLVSGLGSAALNRLGPYHQDANRSRAQTRFPDLRNDEGIPLECKGNFAFNAPNAHNQEEGWFIIWRYIIDRSMTLDPNFALKIFRVDVGYLLEKDWKIMPRGPTSKRTPNSAPTKEGMAKLKPVYFDKRVSKKGRSFEIARS